jgi:hypothetical protein
VGWQEMTFTLLDDIPNTRRRVDFQLSLTFAKHVFNGAKVLFVVVEMFTKFRSVACQLCDSTLLVHFQDDIPSESKEIGLYFLHGVSAHSASFQTCAYHWLLSCFSKTFAIQRQDLALETRQACHVDRLTFS